VELLARVRGLLALRLLKRRMNSLLGKDLE
jgi:hypothetical protein